jgi:hypothetical protein
VESGVPLGGVVIAGDPRLLPEAEGLPTCHASPRKAPSMGAMGYVEVVSGSHAESKVVADRGLALASVTVSNWGKRSVGGTAFRLLRSRQVSKSKPSPRLNCGSLKTASSNGRIGNAEADDSWFHMARSGAMIAVVSKESVDGKSGKKSSVFMVSDVGE